ncbi:MAG TPA: PDZ domain-containing protein, partial [Anaeromyxobacter sp.]
IASAFCSGPAVMIILFQALRKAFKFPIQDEAIWKIAELMSYAMFVNLFLLGAELFKEYYSATEHLLYTEYLWTGIGEHKTLVPYAWFALSCSVVAFVLFLIPRTRRNYVTLNLGCLLIWAGVYIEKGMGLIIPGMTPDTLGQIYEYRPSMTEWGTAAAVFGIGFLVFTMLVKVAVPILVGTFRAPARAAADAPARLEVVRSEAKPDAVPRGERRGYGSYLGGIPDFGGRDAPGVLLTGVRPGSPAERAGIAGGDVLLSVGGVELKSLEDLAFALRSHRPGDDVEVVWRRGDEKLTRTVRLEERR